MEFESERRVKGATRASLSNTVLEKRHSCALDDTPHSSWELGLVWYLLRARDSRDSITIERTGSQVQSTRFAFRYHQYLNHLVFAAKLSSCPVSKSGQYKRKAEVIQQAAHPVR